MATLTASDSHQNIYLENLIENQWCIIVGTQHMLLISLTFAGLLSAGAFIFIQLFVVLSIFF